jgi:hypothetical protein
VPLGIHQGFVQEQIDLVRQPVRQRVEIRDTPFHPKARPPLEPLGEVSETNREAEARIRGIPARPQLPDHGPQRALLGLEGSLHLAQAILGAGERGLRHAQQTLQLQGDPRLGVKRAIMKVAPQPQAFLQRGALGQPP